MDNDVTVVDEKKGEVLVLNVGGRLDAASSPIIEKSVFEFIDAGNRKIVLNFSGVAYLSSAGMRLLLSSTKRLKSLEGNIVVCCLSDMVMDVIKMAGFDHILNIQASEDEALKVFE
ncbi:MAG: STAS domain-containing protein [Waddliaceae bacterium]|jgi:anti-anti-sigma factor|nr:STAS domain-containing protein [Waddliaceae bacterium]MBT3579460.1 STAS domain-containing protein [Waddliaceae bacterium]MBT4444980.1 STAS domain-containing protein [Waddliaceae bacterium]MBT6928959.1 STAS domain-containing protein [Waddliaceae bacterium]MBT7264455.1 STAS domain-containing protein [Waddliaceae bacterium]